MISCSSKKTIFISSCYYHLYCTNTMTATPIWPSALWNNVRFYHFCKRAKELSLFISLPLPYGTGIKCTSEHFRAPLLFIEPLKVICSPNLLAREVFESFQRRACHKKWLKKPPNENLGGVCVNLNHWVHCNVTGNPHSFHIGKVACCVKLWPAIELFGDI